MFSATMVVASVPVVDLERAKTFYADALGLYCPWENPACVRFRCGASSELALFEHPKTVTEHTIAHFEVTDVEGAVRELESKGVTFVDSSEGPFRTTDHVARIGPLRCAWFHDPDGNTLCLRQGG